jgi:hypothetical protein
MVAFAGPDRKETIAWEEQRISAHAAYSVKIQKLSRPRIAPRTPHTEIILGVFVAGVAQGSCRGSARGKKAKKRYYIPHSSYNLVSVHYLLAPPQLLYPGQLAYLQPGQLATWGPYLLALSQVPNLRRLRR